MKKYGNTEYFQSMNTPDVSMIIPAVSVVMDHVAYKL